MCIRDSIHTHTHTHTHTYTHTQHTYVPKSVNLLQTLKSPPPNKNKKPRPTGYLNMQRQVLAALNAGSPVTQRTASTREPRAGQGVRSVESGWDLPSSTSPIDVRRNPSREARTADHNSQNTWLSPPPPPHHAASAAGAKHLPPLLFRTLYWPRRPWGTFRFARA